MGKDKTERVITVDQPGMTQVVTKEYLILPFTDIAINKNFFKWYSLILLLIPYVAVRFFNLDLFLAGWVLQIHLANLWLFAIEIVSIAAVVWVWNHYRVKNKRLEAYRQRQRVYSYTDGGDD